MRGYGRTDLRWSDVTPKANVDEPPAADRPALGAVAIAGPAAAKIATVPSAYSVAEEPNEPRGDHQVQQLLRVRLRQGGPGALRWRPGDGPLVDRDRRAGGPARHLWARGRPDRRRDGGAHLSLSLRRGVVYGRALDRFGACDVAGQGGRAAWGEVRRLRDARLAPSRCPATRRRGSTSPIARGFGWTRRCIR